MEIRKEIRLVFEPTVELIAEMRLDRGGVLRMADWVRDHRPDCTPEGGYHDIFDLLPHNGLESVPGDSDGGMRTVTDNELLAEIAGRKCYDGRTQLLTPSGWVAFPDYLAHHQGQAVATFNAGTEGIEFQVPTDVLQKRHTGRMYKVESRALSIRVTEDHDMWYRPYRGAAWRFAPASELAGRVYGVRRAAAYVGEHAQVTEESLAHAAFLGYYLAEGSLVDGKKYGTGSRVILYQKEEAAGPILACLLKLGVTPYLKVDPRSGVLHVTINDTKLANELAELGVGSSRKRLPREVFQWPAALRATLLDALMWGDGTTAKNGARVYTTVSKQLAVDVQTLIVLSGRPGSISVTPANAEPAGTSFKGNHDVYRVREGTQVVVEVNVKHRHDGLEAVTEEPVYCVTVPNRILVLRRNDKIFMASNCYDSFAEKAGKKTNREYLANTQAHAIKHASILYHTKFSFFIAGVSRRVSHEIIRNYVGADRSEEGSPSQESTRFTHHYGYYVVPPKIAVDEAAVEDYRQKMQLNYDGYTEYIRREVAQHQATFGTPPTTAERKQIYEAASQYLSHGCETSFIWTTNPMAIAKFFKERGDKAADAEIQRLTRKWRGLVLPRYPNLFQGIL